MFHDRRKRHGKRTGEIANRNVLAAIELREQRSPRRVGKGGKGAIERRVLILNHMVKCRDVAVFCQSSSISRSRTIP